MMIEEIKTKLFEILSDELGYEVADHPNGNKNFPCVFLKMGNATRDLFHDTFRFQIKFKIDIFSNYDGEKEILEMEEAIFNATQALYDVVGVTYVRQSDFRILDDKSTSVIRKHGIITFTIVSTGMVEEVEDEQDSSTNP